MAERGVIVDHSTLHRWVIRLVPRLDKAFRRHKRSVGRPWAKGELLISKAIGVPAETIWPSRYFDPQTHAPVTRLMRIRHPK